MSSIICVPYRPTAKNRVILGHTLILNWALASANQTIKHKIAVLGAQIDAYDAR